MTVDHSFNAFGVLYPCGHAAMCISWAADPTGSISLCLECWFCETVFAESDIVGLGTDEMVAHIEAADPEYAEQLKAHGVETLREARNPSCGVGTRLIHGSDKRFKTECDGSADVLLKIEGWPYLWICTYHDDILHNDLGLVCKQL